MKGVIKVQIPLWAMVTLEIQDQAARVTLVQIPLWAMVTVLAELDAAEKGRSDSSMGDGNDQEPARARHGESSDSSMGDGNSQIRGVG